MQTAINPALGQVIGAMDLINPVTSRGEPTVAAQVIQAAQQATLPQVTQQAGLGGQIQAMQMQEAQKALMDAAMQQAKPPAGIESLPAPVGNFAEGGIVGYSGGGTAAMLDPEQYALEVEMMNAEAEARRAERERQRIAQSGVPQQVAPSAQPPQVMPQAAPQMRQPAPAVARQAAPDPMTQGIAATMGERARKEIAQLQGPASPEQVLQREAATRAVMDQFLRSQGVDPDALAKRGEEDKALMEQQRALLRERMERERGRDTFLSRAGAALRGFRQMQGQGTGDAFMSAYDNLARQVQSGEMRMDQFRDMEIRLNELEITRRRSLEDARRATAEGRWKDAQQELANERAAANEIKRLSIGTYMPQAQAMIEEKKVAESAAARAQAAQAQNYTKQADQLRLNIDRLNSALRDIDKEFSEKPQVKAYEGMKLSGKVPPAIETAYQEVMTQKNREIQRRTGDLRDEITRLQTQIYGPGAIKEVAASSAQSAPSAGRVMTMADVQATARASGRTPQQVIEAAKARGIQVQQ